MKKKPMKDRYLANEYLLVYEDAFDHIRSLVDLEWNGKITITHFRDRVNDIITKVSELETGGHEWFKYKVGHIENPPKEV
jgi:hypothetical protein